MKLVTVLLTFLLIAFVSHTSDQRCLGSPRHPYCRGSLDVGRFGYRCTPSTMWYYDARAQKCHEMRYLGCGGNNNRWCTKAYCEHRCKR